MNQLIKSVAIVCLLTISLAACHQNENNRYYYRSSNNHVNTNHCYYDRYNHIHCYRYADGNT